MRKTNTRTRTIQEKMICSERDAGFARLATTAARQVWQVGKPKLFHSRTNVPLIVAAT